MSKLASQKMMSLLQDVTSPTPIPVPLQGWGPQSMSALSLILKHFDIWIPKPEGGSTTNFQQNAAYFKPLVLNPVHVVSSAPITVLPYFPISNHLSEKLDESIQAWLKLSPEKAAALAPLDPTEDRILTNKLWHFVIFNLIIEAHQEWYLNEALRQDVIVLIRLMEQHSSLMKEMAIVEAENISYQHDITEKIIAAIQAVESDIENDLDDFYPLPDKPEEEPEEELKEDPEEESVPIMSLPEPIETDPAPPPKPQKPPKPVETKPPPKPQKPPKPVDKPPAPQDQLPSSAITSQVHFKRSRPVKPYQIESALLDLQSQRDALFLKIYNEARNFCSKEVQLIKTINNLPEIKDMDQQIRFYRQRFGQIDTQAQDIPQEEMRELNEEIKAYARAQYRLHTAGKALQDLKTMLEITNNNQPNALQKIDDLQKKVATTQSALESSYKPAPQPKKMDLKN